MKRIILKTITSFYKKLKSIYFSQIYSGFLDKYEIHKSFKFNGENVLFYGDGEIKIGKNSYIGWNSTLMAAKEYSILIGDNCNISHNVRIYTSSNNPDQVFNSNLEKIKVYGNVIIGNGVWIGANVFINPGIIINDNSVVGANSVVTKDIEKNSTVGGVPAKLIRFKNV